MTTSENLYQNQDLENLNPIKPEETQTVSKSFKLLGYKIPDDPKIMLLIVLGAVVLVLLLISIFVSLFRRGPAAPKRTTPTPTVYITPLPTENVDVSRMPDSLKSKFTETDNNINTSIDFSPPQIDSDIGAN